MWVICIIIKVLWFLLASLDHHLTIWVVCKNSSPTQFPSSHWLYWTFTSITPRILSGEVPPARSQCVASQWLGSSYVMTWGCTSVTVGLQQFMLKFYIAVHCRMINMIWYDMIWFDMIWYDMIWYDIYIYIFIYTLIMVIYLCIVKITYYIEYLDIPSTFFFIFDTWVWINTY